MRNGAIGWTAVLLAVLSLPAPRVQGQDASAQVLQPVNPRGVATEGVSMAPPEMASIDGPGMLTGLRLAAEFLYVHPRQDNLATAILSHGPGDPNGSVESLSWSALPAFRVGGAYQLPGGTWDIGTSYTYFHARDQRTVSAVEGATLAGLLTANPAAQSAADADGDAGLSYGVLDLCAGRTLSVTDSFSARVFGGARLAWINRAFKSIYSGGALGDASDFVNSPVRFQGAGLTAGANCSWDIYRGWGLYAGGQVSLVSGQFQSRRTETIGLAVTSNITDSFDTIVPVTELSVGLRYQGDHFFFSAGYELTNWFDLVTGLAIPEANPGPAVHQLGNLTLDALTVKAGFAF